MIMIVMFENVKDNRDNKTDESIKNASNNYSGENEKASKNDIDLVMNLLTKIRQRVRMIAMTMNMMIIMILTMLIIVLITTLMILLRL